MGDPEFQRAPITTQATFDFLASRDAWIHAAVPAVTKVDDYRQNDNEFFSFYLNTSRYLNQKHHDNEIQYSSTTRAFRERPIKTVIPFEPKLTSSQINTGEKNVEKKTFTNDTDQEQHQEFSYSTTTGEKSSIELETSTSFKESAKFSIEGFEVALDATQTSKTDSTNSRDTSKTETMNQKIVIPPMTVMTVITERYETTHDKYYEVAVHIRGENDQPCVGVPTNKGDLDGAPSWCHFRDFGDPIKDIMSSTIKYRVTTITTNIDFTYEKEAIKPTDKKATKLGHKQAIKPTDKQNIESTDKEAIKPVDKGAYCEASHKACPGE